MRKIAVLSIISIAFASCHAAKITRIPDGPPVAEKIPVATEDKKDPNIPDIQYKVMGTWRLVSTTGGFAGKTVTDYKEHYYTFTADSFFVEKPGEMHKDKYDWEMVKDIHTGKETYQMTGLNLIFTPEGNDTLHADMNAYDGYSYLLVRRK